jgi:hypothetical protein
MMLVIWLVPQPPRAAVPEVEELEVEPVETLDFRGSAWSPPPRRATPVEP